MRFPATPTRLDRYRFRQLFWALVAVTRGLDGLLPPSRLPRFVHQVINRDLSPRVFRRSTGRLIATAGLCVTTYGVIRFNHQPLRAVTW